MSSMRWAALRGPVSAMMLVALPRAASAQPSAENDKVAAQALFEDARQLVAAGKYADACPKFADSERLDASPSTLLNLANCWEKLGRTATAWATYREAQSAANAVRRPDYVAVAERHATALAPTLARLTIVVSESLDGMQIKRDGVLVGSAAWGNAIPVDAGSHTIEASAPAHKSWNTAVEVLRDGAQVTVTIPVLEALPVESSSPPAIPSTAATVSSAPLAPRPESPPRPGTQRAIGLIVAGAGVVGLGVSGVFALVANAKKQDSLSDGHCPITPNQCDPTGVSLRSQAITAGDAATVAFAVGAAALVTGGVLWLTAPRATATNASNALRVALVPAMGGAVVRGSWP